MRQFFQSSLGKKYVMAVSGFLLFGFVIVHMLGNLQIFLGPEAINRYAHFLQATPELLWPARIGLLVMVGLHIWSAIKLQRRSRVSRGHRHGRTICPIHLPHGIEKIPANVRSSSVTTPPM